MSRRYVSNLDERLVAEAASHTHAIWSGGRDLEAHTASQLAQLRRAGPKVLRYVGLVDEERGLVASIKRYGLSVRVPFGDKATAVGIGAVFTRPDARGTGAASELLRHVLDEARASGDVIGLLFSDIDPAFYERLGFIPLTSLEHIAPTESLPASTSLELRPATPDDEPSMLAWYDASWEPSFLRPARTLEILRYFRLRNPAEGAWILRAEGRDVGYALMALRDDRRDDGSAPPPRTLWVDEWAAPGIELADVLGALRVLAEREGAKHVAGWLPPHLAPSPFVAKTRATAIAMVIPLGGALTHVDPERTFFGSLDHF